jgi:hypothetical protein
MRYRLLLCLLLWTTCAFSQTTEPTLKGPVTRYVSMTDFDVSGWKVVRDRETEVLMTGPGGLATNANDSTKLYIGELVSVYGSEQNKTRSIKAEQLRVFPPAARHVEGLAVIEAVLPGADKVVSADGHRIRIAAQTQTKFVKPLSSAVDIGTNVIMKYDGLLQPDGVVLADSATFYQNVVSDAAIKKREQWEYDPQTIKADSKQPGASKFFRGRDASYFPPYDDATMLARLRLIGGKLVPAYQKGLAASDPTRIDFRFYLIDAPKWRDPVPLPSGIVLVPYEGVKRMKNDSQIAALLADKVAWLVEQQPIQLPLTNGQIAGQLGIDAAGAIPFAGLGVAGAEVGVGISALKRMHRNQEQRARVSLALMQEAGFDVTEAPKAWWILSLKDGKDMSRSNPPENVQYMYGLVADRLAAADVVGKNSMSAVGRE